MLFIFSSRGLSSTGFPLSLANYVYTWLPIGQTAKWTSGILIAASGTLNESLICWGIVAELALIKSRANEKSLKNHYAIIVGDTQIALTRGGSNKKRDILSACFASHKQVDTLTDSHSHSLSWHSDSHSHLQ